MLSFYLSRRKKIGQTLGTGEVSKLERADMNGEGDMINTETIQQLLGMDDDDNHEFSSSLMTDYFIQLAEKVEEMKKLLGAGDIVGVGKVGHFLKGSSAALGATAAQRICDSIQHWEKEASHEDVRGFLDGKIKDLERIIPTMREGIERYIRSQ